MIESLSYALALMGALAALAIVAAVQYRFRLVLMRRERDRLAHANRMLRRGLSGSVRQARDVNESLDRLAIDLEGEILEHGEHGRTDS